MKVIHRPINFKGFHTGYLYTASNIFDNDLNLSNGLIGNTFIRSQEVWITKIHDFLKKQNIKNYPINSIYL